MRSRIAEDGIVLRSVVTALRAVEILARAEGSVGLSEVADRLGVAPSTAHRVLVTLVSMGFARQDPDRRYRVGPAIARLADQPGPPPLLRDTARPVLRWLAEATGETVHLAVLDGTSVVTIDHASGHHGDDAVHVVGARVPAHATAVGLALLAHHPDVVEAVLRGGLERWTERTIADPGVLRRQLGDVRRRGYAVNLRGWLDETAGVAAPVVLLSGEAVASIGISGPASRLGRRGALTALGPVARTGAMALATRLTEAPPIHPVRAGGPIRPDEDATARLDVAR
jgi:DNA-binding IclR family transcriptional regulator